MNAFLGSKFGVACPAKFNLLLPSERLFYTLIGSSYSHNLSDELTSQSNAFSALPATISVGNVFVFGGSFIAAKEKADAVALRCSDLPLEISY